MGAGYRLRILHISDLHVRGERERERWRRRRVLGDAWQENLAAIAGDGDIDLVCFTGDVAYSGRADEYVEATDFLDATLATLKLTRERLFVVPGNHDVDRKLGDRAWRALRALPVHPAEADMALSRWMAGGKAPAGIENRWRHGVLNRQKRYRQWLETLDRAMLLPDGSPHGRLGYRATVRLPGRPFDVHLIGLDSAWLAGDNHDSGKLRLTEDQVMRLGTDGQGARLAGFRLALVHHPLDELADGEHCRRLLADHVDLLLRGHRHETQPDVWADPDRRLHQLAAGCLYEHDRYANACIVITAVLDQAGRPLRYDLRFRAWSPRGGHWFDDDSLYRGSKHGRLTWWVNGEAPRPLPPPRPQRVFVGRARELAAIEHALLEAGQPVAICALQGMPGVGKTFLAERFAGLHAARFPGGHVRLALAPDDRRTADDLRDALVDALGIQTPGASAWAAVQARLQAPRTLVHVDNVDSEALATVVAALVRALPGCAMVVTGRFRALGQSGGWARVDVPVFDEPTARQQLAQEYRPARGTEEDAAHGDLVRALGFLPLAIHLAAGYLHMGHTPAGFLRRLRERGLDVAPLDPADPVLDGGRAKAVLRSTFELSLDTLRATLERDHGARAESMMAGLAALGHAPAAGVGISLGAAIAGLPEPAHDNVYEDLVVAARTLSILEPVPEDARPGGAVRVHPLLAERLREDAARALVLARMTEWFVARLPGGGADQGTRWAEVHGEHAALVAWLAEVPEEACAQVVEAGMQYAWQCGPFLVWAGFCERCVELARNDDQRSKALWTLSRTAERGGDLDRALAAAEHKARIDRERDEERELALARGRVADILASRGELAEALRIRQEEELPVYERLGDVRSRAVTQGQIADILASRGELAEALRIYQEEVLPAFERPGAVRERAVTQGKIADILVPRGELAEALRIRQEEELPVYERLGDVRERAVTQGQIADILASRGELAEALRIRQEDVLPVYERLGARPDLASGRANLAILHLSRNQPGDRDAAAALLRQALADATAMNLAEARQILVIMLMHGIDPA